MLNIIRVNLSNAKESLQIKSETSSVSKPVTTTTTTTSNTKARNLKKKTKLKKTPAKKFTSTKHADGSFSTVSHPIILSENTKNNNDDDDDNAIDIDDSNDNDDDESSKENIDAEKILDESIQMLKEQRKQAQQQIDFKDCDKTSVQKQKTNPFEDKTKTNDNLNKNFKKRMIQSSSTFDDNDIVVLNADTTNTTSTSSTVTSNGQTIQQNFAVASPITQTSQTGNKTPPQSKSTSVVNDALNTMAKYFNNDDDNNNVNVTSNNNSPATVLPIPSFGEIGQNTTSIVMGFMNSVKKTNPFDLFDFGSDERKKENVDRSRKENALKEFIRFLRKKTPELV